MKSFGPMALAFLLVAGGAAATGPTDHTFVEVAVDYACPDEPVEGGAVTDPSRIERFTDGAQCSVGQLDLTAAGNASSAIFPGTAPQGGVSWTIQGAGTDLPPFSSSFISVRTRQVQQWLVQADGPTAGGTLLLDYEASASAQFTGDNGGFMDVALDYLVDVPEAGVSGFGFGSVFTDGPGDVFDLPFASMSGGGGTADAVWSSAVNGPLAFTLSLPVTNPAGITMTTSVLWSMSSGVGALGETTSAVDGIVAMGDGMDTFSYRIEPAPGSSFTPIPMPEPSPSLGLPAGVAAALGIARIRRLLARKDASRGLLGPARPART